MCVQGGNPRYETEARNGKQQKPPQQQQRRTQPVSGCSHPQPSKKDQAGNGEDQAAFVGSARDQTRPSRDHRPPPEAAAAVALASGIGWETHLSRQLVDINHQEQLKRLCLDRVFLLLLLWFSRQLVDLCKSS